MVKKETVSIIYQHPKILLGMKKLRFGKGKYNGFGGGIEDDETLKECAIRETFEETGGITMINLVKMGRLLFYFQTDEDDHDVHFFRATQFKGIPKETDEMKPEWFNLDSIPYDKMWIDDRYWLPLLLDGKCFRGEFEFDLEGEIARYELNEVTKID
jgi:8-oxo-dGTP pyrophosphatase MutT (NUDIX family)